MRALLLASAIAAMTACAGTPDASPAADTQSAAATRDVPAEGLLPQRLAPGQCGLFLWGMSAPRKFVFFTEGTAGDALILIDDMATRLPMTSAGGDVFGQFLTQMGFTDAATGSTVVVTIEPGEALEGGQRVDTGNILFRNAEGWETILPVTGVRACMPG